MTGKTIGLVASAVLAAAALVAMVLGVIFGPQRGPEEPTSAPTFVIETPEAVDRVGRATGDFEPIAAPSGMPLGTGADPGPRWLTADGQQASDTLVIARLPQPGAGTPVVAIRLDGVSDAIGEPELARLVAELGVDWRDVNNGGINAQRIELRARMLAGDGAAAWSLGKSLQFVSTAGNPMPAFVSSSCDSAPLSATFEGHGADSGDTLKLCLYVFGDVMAPNAALGYVQIGDGVYLDSPTYDESGFED